MVLTGVLVTSGLMTASAAETRYFQYSKDQSENVADEPGSAYDILGGQMAITTDGDFQFYIVIADYPELNDPSDLAYYYVEFDTDLDGAYDYWMNVNATSLSEEETSIVVLDAENQDDQYCTASAWITTAGSDDAIGFGLDYGCFDLQPTLNVQFGAVRTDAEYVNPKTDSLPSVGFDKFKTSYMAGQVCTAAKNNKKITYLGKTYICMKSSGKWVYKDYGAQLALKAKYYTDKSYYTCLCGKIGANLRDSSKTLTISGAGKYLITDADLTCVENTAKFPAWLKTQIGMTRALDGMQRATYSGYEVTWTYHPDAGVNMTIRKK